MSAHEMPMSLPMRCKCKWKPSGGGNLDSFSFLMNGGTPLPHSPGIDDMLVLTISIMEPRGKQQQDYGDARLKP